MTVRVHPFPSRTRQLSSLVLTILGWKRPGTISRCQHKERDHCATHSGLSLCELQILRIREERCSALLFPYSARRRYNLLYAYLLNPRAGRSPTGRVHTPNPYILRCRHFPTRTDRCSTPRTRIQRAGGITSCMRIRSIPARVGRQRDACILRIPYIPCCRHFPIRTDRCGAPRTRIQRAGSMVSCIRSCLTLRG